MHNRTFGMPVFLMFDVLALDGVDKTGALFEERMQVRSVMIIIYLGSI